MNRIDGSFPEDDAGWEKLHGQYADYMQATFEAMPVKPLEEFRIWVMMELSDEMAKLSIEKWRSGHRNVIARGTAEVDQFRAGLRDKEGEQGQGR